MAPLFNMFKQAAGQWVRIAVPINTVLGFFSDAKQFSDYLAHRAAKWDLRFAKICSSTRPLSKSSWRSLKWKNAKNFEIHHRPSEIWPPTSRGRSGAPPAPEMRFRANFHKMGW